MVGTPVVGDAVVGDAVVGPAVVGEKVVGESVVGDAVVGEALVGVFVVGACVGESVSQQVHSRLVSESTGTVPHATVRPDWSGMLHSPFVSAESVSPTMCGATLLER